MGELKMKKVLMLFLTLMLLFMFSTVAFAYRIGDVIGASLITDIVAKINGYDIASYNYQGYTYVVAEDLANYGFSVSYDNNSRSLSITRNYGVTNIYSTYKKEAVAAKDVGKKAYNILYTDIKTYLDGNYVPSYNINGKTIINFESLKNYGTYVWDNATRKISLDMSGIEKKGYASQISNADYSYQSRLTWEDSVPKLDWKANEACLNMLRIIAKELDTSGAYASQISNADYSYQSRLSWEDSVPKLNWKVNEACLNMLRIIATELDR